MYEQGDDWQIFTFKVFFFGRMIGRLCDPQTIQFVVKLFARVFFIDSSA